MLPRKKVTNTLLDCFSTEPPTSMQGSNQTPHHCTLQVSEVMRQLLDCFSIEAPTLMLHILSMARHSIWRLVVGIANASNF